MSKTKTILIDNRMLVPKELIPRSALDLRYKITLFDERMCVKCDNAPLRPNDLCKSCSGLTAAYKLYREHGPDHWSVPQGDHHALVRLLRRRDVPFEVDDRRSSIPFKTKGIKFTGKLFGANHVDENGIARANQKRLLKAWLKRKEGLLQARPRSGKTVMATWLACRLQQRTVVLADRFELLKQFYKTYMGDPAKGRPAMTNIPELQERTGREIIRLALKAKDLKNLGDVDILLVNYQKLVRDPAKMAELVNGNYSFLQVDEVHGAGATGYLRVVTNCNVKYRLGLTATPRRKDNRHKMINRIMGQVVAKSESTSLIPNVVVKQSEVNPPRSYQQWTYAMGWLCGNIDLRKEMLKELFKDLRGGHEVIIVPLDRKKHIDQLTKMVNQQARTNNRKRGEAWPEQLAIKFYDGVDRDSVLDAVDAPGPTVLFAMRSMIKQGIDFLRPSMIYVYIPMSASTDRETGAPQFDQLANRVSTPYKKPQPVIKLWFHNMSMFSRCNTGLFWNEIWPNRYRGPNQGKYNVEKSTMERIKLIGASKTRTQAQAAAKKTFDW